MDAPSASMLAMRGLTRGLHNHKPNHAGASSIAFGADTPNLFCAAAA